jgi:hypothetical protein
MKSHSAVLKENDAFLNISSFRYIPCIFHAYTMQRSLVSPLRSLESVAAAVASELESPASLEGVKSQLSLAID